MPLVVELVSPERTLFSGDATMVRARTVGGGDIAFLAGHAPFVGALAISTVEISLAEGGSEKAAVQNGDDDEAIAALARASARLVTVEQFH